MLTVKENLLAQRPLPQLLTLKESATELRYLQRMSAAAFDFQIAALEFPELKALLFQFSKAVDERAMEIVEHIHGDLLTAVPKVKEPGIAEFRLDSRIIAEKLNVEHNNLLETLRKYRAKFEAFGVLPFQTVKPTSPKGGRPSSYYELNEPQAHFLATLSRNTEKVVEFKAWLVREFDKYRNGTNYVPPAPVSEIKVLQHPTEVTMTVRQWAAVSRRTEAAVTRQIRRAWGNGYRLSTALTASEWLSLYEGQPAPQPKTKAAKQKAKGTPDFHVTVTVQEATQKPKPADTPLPILPNYFTVSGYLSFHGYRTGLESAQDIGKRCVRVSAEHGYMVQKVKHEVYGRVNAYHADVLKAVTGLPELPF